MIGSPASHQCEFSARRPVAARQGGQHRPIRALSSAPSGTMPGLLRKILFLLVRLKRFINARVAAAIAHHEQQAALFAQRQQLDQCQLDSTRIYRGPIDQLFAKAAELKRAA